MAEISANETVPFLSMSVMLLASTVWPTSARIGVISASDTVNMLSAARDTAMERGFVEAEARLQAE